MNEYKTIREIKNLAASKISGNRWKCFLVTVFPFLLTQLIGNRMLTSNTYINIPIVFLIDILKYLFRFGVAFFFLKFTCTNESRAADVFTGFYVNLNQHWLIALIMVGIYTICELPLTITFAMVDLPLSMSELIKIAVGGLISLCLYVPVTLCFAFVPFLAMDFPQKKATEIIKTCFRIMNGKRTKLLLLELSFIPLYLLSILTYGIGFLFVIPYTQECRTYLFLECVRDTDKQ